MLNTTGALRGTSAAQSALGLSSHHPSLTAHTRSVTLV